MPAHAMVGSLNYAGKLQDFLTPPRRLQNLGGEGGKPEKLSTEREKKSGQYGIWYVICTSVKPKKLVIGLVSSITFKVVCPGIT